MILHLFILLASCFLLFLAAKWMISALVRMAKFLEWREFVMAFMIVAIAASLPNFFVGITSAVQGIPELSFGDIVGGNLVDLTVAIALAVFFAKELPAASKMVQTSALFTMIIAILPLLLILDGKLGRGDGIILIFIFFLYLFWLFSKKDRFSKEYEPEKKADAVRKFSVFIKDIGKLVLGIVFLIVAAQGIVTSAQYFSEALGLPLVLVGILLVGLGNALPETYFAIIAARKAQTWMILGDLMGSVICASTLVLGIVALIHPIEIPDFSPFAIARFFLIISAIFFLFFVRTERRITKKEALFLLGLYIAFVAIEIYMR